LFSSIFCKDQKCAQLTILVYMQADNNLAPFALGNMQSMQNAGYNKEINVLVQWIQPHSKTVNRCFIDFDSMMKIDSILPVQETFCHQTSIVQSMIWAKDKFPAKYYMLVLWNHGAGIIDHEKYPYSKGFVSQQYQSWIKIPGIEYVQDRGILYSDTTRTYLDTKQLGETLKIIKEDVLHKPIDIVGMDACFMAMLEIGYQIKDYARYFVASQNAESGEGWNYQGLLKALKTKGFDATPLDFAQAVVSTYEDFYWDKFYFYTQSVVDLSKIKQMKEVVDKIVSNFLYCQQLNKSHFLYMVKRARSCAVCFDIQLFVDIHSFYKNMLGNSKKYLQENPDKSFSAYSKALENLNVALEEGMENVEQVVQANVVGPILKYAKGISFYFPQKAIHSSYGKTLFAKESIWFDFIKIVVGQGNIDLA
ncbi:MAG: clostripain-related cysteine peptidase, partial [bacterium]